MVITKKHKNMVARRIVSAILCFASFSGAASCHSEPEDVELENGFEEIPYWLFSEWQLWNTALRTTSKKAISKQIDVYYGSLEFLRSNELKEGSDLNQILTFTLTRNVYQNDRDNIYDKDPITLNILLFDIQLSELIDGKMMLQDHYMTDIITAEDLYPVESDGVVTYNFTIKPKYEEEMKLYIPNYAFENNMIKTYDSAMFYYGIDSKGMISISVPEPYGDIVCIN